MVRVINGAMDEFYISPGFLFVCSLFLMMEVILGHNQRKPFKEFTTKSRVSCCSDYKAHFPAATSICNLCILPGLFSVCTYIILIYTSICTHPHKWEHTVQLFCSTLVFLISHIYPYQITPINLSFPNKGTVLSHKCNTASLRFFQW